jgi:phosphate transport system permease protein
VFGLFAYAFFVGVLAPMNQFTEQLFGMTTLDGILAMIMLELPIVIQASKDALNRVPQGFKMAAYAVGSTKWQAIRFQVLPYAWPGALTGTILALARGIGETATIIFVGAAMRISGLLMVGLLSPFTTLSISLFAYLKTTPFTTLPIQYGIAFLLLIITLALNLIATGIRHRFQNKMKAYLEAA